MEQQKLLWIIFALATGFLVVVAAAFILFVPPAETPLGSQDAAAVDSEAFDVTNYLKNGEEPLALEDTDSGDGETSFVIGVSEDEGADSPAGDAEPSFAPQETPQVSKPAPEPAPSPAASVTPAKPAPAKTVRVTEYWIQAGSFTMRSSAESARLNLKQQEFDSVIFTKSVGGTDYYRVRIGPYRYKAEAEKFLEYVKHIENFEQSQIYEVYVQKTL
jgi:cell division septation protein DedD